MKIDKETLLNRCAEKRDMALVVAITTAPEEEVSYIPIVVNGLVLCAAAGVEAKELEAIANALWKRIAIEIGGTAENFTTDVLRELRDISFLQTRNQELYNELVRNEEFWRKFLMA